MAARKKTVRGAADKGANGRRSSKFKDGPVVMDTKAVFAALYEVCEENAAYFSGGSKPQMVDAARRLLDSVLTIQEHARSLEPVVCGFTTIFHHFDFDPHIPANGYRSLVKVVRCCLLHIIHKGRYITSNRQSIFFRAAHSAGEMEAYCSALCQLRALIYLAQRLLHDNSHGSLFYQNETGLSQSFLREYASMYKGCFYGRCVGFQFAPSIRSCLQSITIGLVAFGENYKKHQTGIGVAASSFFTSGKYVIDPELRGLEYERITQNLDIYFWKRFWNITETEVLAGLAIMTSSQVKVNRTLSVPPVTFDLPLVTDPQRRVTVCPPVSHLGPGPVQMRLISNELRDGQDSEELLAMSRPDGGPISLSMGMKTRHSAPSPWLVVHFHGGGFVAQTSKSHEFYLRNWSQDLNAPILSVDYSLAPEVPFPRALEECFYSYCWAVKHHRLLGWTGERVCLAGDSAGGNLCLTVSMRAVAHGVRLPDGIMAAYPATMLSTCVSPSRLLSVMDPILPLSVLSRCLSAYAGTVPHVEKQVEKVSMRRRDTAMLFRDIRQGASNWIHSLRDPSRTSADSLRNSVSEGAVAAPQCDPKVSGTSLGFSKPLKSQTSENLVPDTISAAANSATLSLHQNLISDITALHQEVEDDVSVISSKDVNPSLWSSVSSVALPPPNGDTDAENPSEFPKDFAPIRSERLAEMKVDSSPVFRNPYMSPLLAPDSMLKGLPPVHIVACALDPILDDSVMFAKRLQNLEQPVTLCVVDDLPHGFLCLSQLSKETREASNICMERIRHVFTTTDSKPLERHKHCKLKRTSGTGPRHSALSLTKDSRDK